MMDEDKDLTQQLYQKIQEGLPFQGSSDEEKQEDIARKESMMKNHRDRFSIVHLDPADSEHWDLVGNSSSQSVWLRGNPSPMWIVIDTKTGSVIDGGYKTKEEAAQAWYSLDSAVSWAMSEGTLRPDQIPLTEALPFQGQTEEDKEEAERQRVEARKDWDTLVKLFTDASGVKVIDNRYDPTHVWSCYLTCEVYGPKFIGMANPPLCYATKEQAERAIEAMTRETLTDLQPYRAGHWPKVRLVKTKRVWFDYTAMTRYLDRHGIKYEPIPTFVRESINEALPFQGLPDEDKTSKDIENAWAFQARLDADVKKSWWKVTKIFSEDTYEYYYVRAADGREARSEASKFAEPDDSDSGDMNYIDSEAAPVEDEDEVSDWTLEQYKKWREGKAENYHE